MLETKKAYDTAIAALDDSKAIEIISIDVTRITTLTDSFIISTGTSNRHRKAIADEVEEKVNAAGYETLSKEGYNGANWILLDFGYIVVNVFASEARKKFNLERLWSDGVLQEIRNK